MVKVSPSYNFIVRCCVALVLCVVIGFPAGIISVEIYADQIVQHNYARAQLHSGYLSVAIIGLISGFLFTFQFGTVRAIVSRLALGAVGGIVFGALHAFYWLPHGYAHAIGFFRFFLPYSIAWGIICGVVFAFLCAPILSVLSIKLTPKSVRSETERHLIITSAITIACAALPLIYQFLTHRPSNKEAVIVLASFEACPSTHTVAQYHSLSIPQDQEHFILTLNQKIAPVIGPYPSDTAQRLMTYQTKEGNFANPVFLLDSSDILAWDVCTP